MELFKFQKEAIAEIDKHLKTQSNLCLSWYTGAGKTNVFIAFIARKLKENPKLKFGISAYFTIEIRDQIFARLEDFNLTEKAFIFSAGKIDLTKNIFIFNPQAIFRKDLDLKFDYFIIDEGHAGMDRSCSMIKSIRHRYCTDKTKTLIVSATPWDTLSLKEFKDCKVMKRPLDQGLKDGLITDFEFHAEEAQIEFSDDDFSRAGDLKTMKDVGQFTVLKSVCMGKLKYLVKKYNKQLGKKVLVICPPGNGAEIAKDMADEFRGLPFVMTLGGRNYGDYVDTRKNLEKFKSDPKTRFLFVINKCGVGFDMQELSSVVDLTMSRNIKVLAQRCGRVARKNGAMKKSYFYVYDKSLMKNRLEWLLYTMTDFCLGHYDGWTTKTAKYRPVEAKGLHGKVFDKSILLTEIIDSLVLDNSILNKRTLTFVNSSQPTKWTLASATAEAIKFESRTEMWREKPAIYKWFRLNAKAEMDKLFPLKHHINKWNLETIEALMKEKSGTMKRNAFKKKNGGIWYFLEYKMKKEDALALLDKYFPSSAAPHWTEERVIEKLKTVSRWVEVRKIGGMRSWMNRNGRESKWKNIWMEMVPNPMETVNGPGNVKVTRPIKREPGTMRQRVLANIRKERERTA